MCENDRRMFFKGTMRYSLHKQASASLKSGLDLREIVRLPDSEDEDDWIAVHGKNFSLRIHRKLDLLSSRRFLQSNKSRLRHRQRLLYTGNLSNNVRRSSL